MTDIEKKALALLNEVREERGHPAVAPFYLGFSRNEDYATIEALCRAIEQHEAFRQEVSDAVRVLDEFITGSEDYKRGSRTAGVHLSDGRSVKFARFIIADPDPLVEAIEEIEAWPPTPDQLVAALAKHGGKIVWENSDA